MAHLTTQQVDAYERDGFLFPLDVVPPSRAGEIRKAVEAVERGGAARPRIGQYAFNVAHLVIPEVRDLVLSDAVLDPVEDVLGHDLMLWGTGFFIKEAATPNYVSWHQDLTYWGLDDAAEVTAWIAFTPSNEGNGAMRFIPGSHGRPIVRHRDTFAKENLLSRGQEIAVAVDEHAAVTVELEAGQMSLHHGRLFHASGPNASADRRIGLAVRYIRPEMRQTVGHRDYATLVRGEDRFGHFRPHPEPAFDLAPPKLAAIDAMLDDQNAFLYAGAAKKGRRFAREPAGS